MNDNWLFDIVMRVLTTSLGPVLSRIWDRRRDLSLGNLHFSTREAFVWLLAFCILLAIAIPSTDSMAKAFLSMILSMFVVLMVMRLR